MTGLLEILEQSRDLGFLGRGPVETHVEQAEAFLAATPPPERFLDLGSGGGVPGLVLASAWPEVHGVLLDSQLRRVRFLERSLVALGLDGRVAAVHGRAEELAWDPVYRGCFVAVTARSFGGPGVTAECGAGFLVAGGRLLVAEPPGGPDRWPAAGLAVLGLADSGAVSGSSSSVRVLTSLAGPVVGVPRRTAALARSPRF